jgi:hypothetical protein
MTQTGRLYLRIFFGSIVVGGILGYTYFQSIAFLRGPILSVEFPQNGATLEESLVTVVGSASYITKLSLNGRPIFIDEDGRFSEKLLLMYGYNIITLEANDRFDRTTRETLELVYK